MSPRPSGRKMEFFKVYLPDQSSQRMRVPPAFVKLLNGAIPNKARLKDLSGKNWPVEMEEAENGVFLKDGWKRFASHHSLEMGSFLVFTYHGDSSFDVKIFGNNGCMKEIALGDQCINKGPSTVKKFNPLVKVEKESQTCPTLSHSRKRKYAEVAMKRSEKSSVAGSNEASRRRSLKFVSHTPEVAMKRSEKYNGFYEASRRRSLRLASQTVKQLRASDTSEVSLLKNLHAEVAMIRSEKSNVAGFNEESRRQSPRFASQPVKQLGAVDTPEFLLPKNPSFIASFRQSSQFRVNFPKKFLAEADIIMDPEMSLRGDDGKLWPISIHHASDGQLSFGKGWGDFRNHHKLVGPSKKRCAFEFLLRRGRRRVCREIAVHIIPPGPNAKIRRDYEASCKVPDYLLY